MPPFWRWATLSPFAVLLLSLSRQTSAVHSYGSGLTDAPHDVAQSIGNAFLISSNDAPPPLDPLRPRAADARIHHLLTGERAAGDEQGKAKVEAARARDRRATLVQSASFPPSAWLNINNITTLSMVSAQAVNRMQTWLGSNNQYEWTPWWEYAIAGIAYADLDLALGNSTNKQLILNLLDRNSFGVDWMIDKYIDDQLWWAMLALKAYELYGGSSYLQGAVAIQRNSSSYWDNTCGGGPQWLTTQPLTKNTITTALYMSVNARLYRWTGQASYWNETMRTLNWWLDWAFEPTTGRVYDTISGPDCSPSGLQIYTYNSGSMMSGLVDVYYVTGNETILNLARSIAYAGMRDYSSASTGVVQESCEHDPPQSSNNNQPGCGQDQLTFKAVFVAGLSYLYAARPTDTNLYNYINTQFLSNTFNNVDDSWLFGPWWAGPWNVTTAGPKTQIAALGMLAATVTADVAFNALVQAQGGAATAS